MPAVTKASMVRPGNQECGFRLVTRPLPGDIPGLNGKYGDVVLLASDGISRVWSPRMFRWGRSCNVFREKRRTEWDRAAGALHKGSSEYTSQKREIPTDVTRPVASAPLPDPLQG